MLSSMTSKKAVYLLKHLYRILRLIRVYLIYCKGRMIWWIFYFALNVVKSDRGVLISSKYSGLLTNVFSSLKSEEDRNMWFAVRFVNCENWIHTKDHCPVFLDCKVVEQGPPETQDRKALGITQWEKKIITDFPKYQDVIGGLCLAPDGVVAKQFVTFLEKGKDGVINLKLLTYYSTTKCSVFENPFTERWGIRAYSLFPKSEAILLPPSMINDFVLELDSYDHLIPKRFSKHFYGQIQNNRLYVNCQRFDASSGKSNQFIHFLNTKNKHISQKLYVRKSEEPFEPICRPGKWGFGKKCYCSTNIVFSFDSKDGRIGRSVLEDYKLVLDSEIIFRERNLAESTADPAPSPKIYSNRLDHDSLRSDFNGFEFQWVPATEPSTLDDFIFLTDPLIPNVEEISTLLLDKSDGIKGRVFPEQFEKEVIGKLEITKTENGAILVKERRDSMMYKPVVTDLVHLKLVEAPENTDLITFDG